MRNHYNYSTTLIFLFGLFNFYLLSQPVKFKHLTVEDGLSNNKVNSVIQDQFGFIWFGTNDGLNRYDGYNFKIFRHDPDDSSSISNNCITSLYEDKNGIIWIGTKIGIVDKYDFRTEKFAHIKLDFDVEGNNEILSIYIDSKNNIWIGTHLDGLFKLNAANNTVAHWNMDKSKANSLSNNYVNSICEDNNGNIIIGTYNGLNIFDPENPENGFKTFYNEVNRSNSLSSNLIWAVSQSSIDTNIIWIGTFNGLTKYNLANSTFERIKIDTIANVPYGASCGYTVDEIIDGEKIIWVNSYGGLSRINLTTGKSFKFIHRESDPASLINNQINQIIKDRTGVLWVATEGGVSYSTSKSNLFNSLVFMHNSILPLKKKSITAISKFNDNKIWIGTNEGLYLLTDINSDPMLKKIKQFNGYYIWSIEAFDKNEIWVGTYGKGLKQFNYIKKKIKKWDFAKTKFSSQSVYFNRSLLKDGKGNIWIGYWGIGVAQLNPRTGEYRLWLNEKDDPKSLSYNSVWVIKEDHLGRIWLGTQGGGLDLFEDIDGGVFYHWLKTNGNKPVLNSNSIYSICEATKLKRSDNSETILWIGTDNGLTKLIITNNSNIYDVNIQSVFYTVKEGLADNTIKSIIEDEQGNLWLGTNLGISFFNIRENTFTNFSKEDGINGTVMNSESALKLDNGIILIGSTEGLNIFNPKKIKLSHYEPNLVITDFKIFNKSVEVGKSDLFKESVLTKNEINLSYDQDVFSFEFATLDYNSSRSIKYAYKMEGFDNDWIYCGSRRYVTYTNLDPGRYTFLVKSTNADGIWNNNSKSILIIIDPPFWKTWWAYTVYTLIIIIGFYSFRKYETNKRKAKEEARLKAASEKAKLRESELRAETAEYKAKVLETKQEIEKQQLRNRISTDLHDDIGSNLSSIILLSSLVDTNLNADNETKKYITEIKNAAKVSAEAIRDIVWIINPTSDQVNKLVTKMVETANIMLANIKYDIKKSDSDFEEKIPPNVKRNIFLIYKEILTNIIKHSQADFVKIEIISEKKLLKISIEDNGVGFDVNSRNSGNGLRNLKYRAKQISGNLTITSEKDKGTLITFTYNIA